MPSVLRGGNCIQALEAVQDFRGGDVAGVALGACSAQLVAGSEPGSARQLANGTSISISCDANPDEFCTRKAAAEGVLHKEAGCG